MGFCADVASPEKLMCEGGIDAERAHRRSRAACPPVTAIQMATINNAEAFHALHDIGLVAPGRYADMLFVDDLRDFTIQRVMVGGRTVVQDGELVAELPRVDYPASFYDTVQARAASQPRRARERPSTTGPRTRSTVRVIGVTDGSLETDERHASCRSPAASSSPTSSSDVLPLAMIDRFGKGTGDRRRLRAGLRLRRGAIASSVNAVCENLVVVGTSPEDMALAVNPLAEIGGGKIVVADGEVTALVELPIYGLVGDEPLADAIPKFEALNDAVAALGSPLSSPFTSLEFSCNCGAIPDIRLSDDGLARTIPAERLDVVVGVTAPA